MLTMAAPLMSRRQQPISNLFLLCAKRRIKRLAGGDQLVQPLRACRHHLLPSFETFNGARRLPLRALSHLRPPILNAFVRFTCLLAQGRSEGLPLRLLRIGDLQRRLYIGESRFYALTGHPEWTLAMLVLPWVTCLRRMLRRCRLRDGRRNGGSQAGGEKCSNQQFVHTKLFCELPSPTMGLGLVSSTGRDAGWLAGKV